MRILRLEATDHEILALVSEWVTALATGDFTRAFEMTAHDPYYGWTPDLIRGVIAGYGSLDPDPNGVAHCVTPIETAEEGVIPQQKVTRWAEPRDVGSGRRAVGDVLFDIPLDGRWSDLTARFEIQQGVADTVLVLTEIHVF